MSIFWKKKYLKIIQQDVNLDGVASLILPQVKELWDKKSEEFGAMNMNLHVIIGQNPVLE